ncbi:MAG: FliH/SctL family protein [Eubacteriales bacterium]
MSKVIKSLSVKMESPVIIEHEDITVSVGTETVYDNQDEEGDESNNSEQKTGTGHNFEHDTGQIDEQDLVPNIEKIKEQAGEILRETEQMVKELIETARLESEKIIKSANEEATRTVSEGREKIKKIEDEAQQQGWQDGYEHGLRSAEQEYFNKIEEAQNLVEKAHKERQEVIVGSEDEIVQLAIAVARKVIGHELAANPDTIVDIVKRAIQKVTDREELTIRVNPDNLDCAINSQDEITQSVKGVRKLKILSDPTVSLGGCVVESPNGTVDARMERQLSEIEQALMEVGPNA